MDTSFVFSAATVPRAPACSFSIKESKASFAAGTSFFSGALAISFGDVSIEVKLRPRFLRPGEGDPKVAFWKELLLLLLLEYPFHHSQRMDSQNSFFVVVEISAAWVTLRAS